MNKNRIEVNVNRELIKMFSNLKDIDSIYTFYYDETNNIRKFYLRNDGFNAPENANFVLGGVMYEGLTSTVNVSLLENELRLQKNIKEIKLKHLATGDLLQCLKSEKLHTFFNWLLKSDLFIHYSSINILYYSIVDIVDSLVISKEYKGLDPNYINLLKDSLYQLVLLEKEEFLNLLYTFEYPNIKKAKVTDFIVNLMEIIRKHDTNPELHLGLTSIMQMLKQSKKKDEELTFIMNESDYQLIEDFSHFYLRPIGLFKNATHIFDEEESIQYELDGIQLLDNGIEIFPYKFENSKNDKLIQISDVIVGFIGKFAAFINSKSKFEVAETKSRLTDIQCKNLKLFGEIIDKSDSKNPALLMNVSSYFELEKSSMLLSI